ncbi:MAG: T9SS type A sorting domain-containing protein [Lewinellaceae bacterium]|nr:T9SS type A sorting domain-containing protein [Phaeodactylibacter sp.]MCB9041663.1 T9SS type A sorting domain-containing protein [Lewinellaceae bacterium]
MKATLFKYLISSVLLLACLSVAQSQDMVANYPFNGNVNDASSFGNHASVHGALLAQDRFGNANKAFSFDGEQAYIQAPNAAQLNSDYVTVSLWVRPDALPEQGEVFLLSFGGWQERFKISLPGHGKPVFTTNSSSGISDMDAGDGNNLTVGEWGHVAVVHDGTNDKVYINGALANTKAVSGTLNSTDKPLGMGYDPIGAANFFNGALDEVAIFNGALSDQAIADLYAAQLIAPVVPPGMVANYAFSNNATDGTSYANHGTVTDARLTADRFGFGNSAYEFNGISSRIDAPNSNHLNSALASVSFWVKVNELPAQGEVFLLSFGGWQERWKISLPGHGKPVFTTNATGGISDMDSGDGNELTPGVWKQVVMVHDGSKDLIYMDGALANEKNVAGDLNPTTHPLGMGYNPVDGGGYFDGALDEVKIYNVALTAQEVADLYTAESTSPAQPTDLVADFPFAGNADDVTQFENNGSVGGAQLSVDRFGFGGNAYSFAGADSILVSNSVQYNSPLASVSFWVKPDELPAQGEVYLLSFGGWQERWKISLPGHGKPVFTTNSTGGISDMDSGDGNELAVGEWKHVVMVHDGTKDLIYMDGALANEKNVAGDLNSTNYPFGIGNNPIDGGSYFVGQLDDIQLYDVALSAQQVADLYAAQNMAPMVGDGLVADYPFSGNGKDVTPYRNNATVSGAQLADDRFGRANKAYQFDGVNDEAMANNSVQLNSDYTTVGFWINVNELPAQGEAYLLSFGGWQERWKISLPSHGKMVWTTNNTSGISDMDAGDGNELQPGAWTYVAMVHDGAKDKIYINGVSVAEKDVSGTLNSTAYPLGMGFNIVDGGSYFNGSLDDIQIYNVALTSQEIADLYAAQSLPPIEADVTPPTAPLNFAATVNFTDVSLSWLPSTDDVGVAAYNLFQDAEKIMTTPGTTASIFGLQQLTQFTFGITAVDEAGNESQMTTLQVMTGEDQTPDVTPPTAPGNLMASPGSSSVALSWDASVDDRGVAGYVVLLDGFYYDSIPGNSTSILVGGLDPETLYTFEVYAFDMAGNNSDVAEITLSTTAELETSEPGLVAWYRFENDANDATPYNNHGAIGGNPTFAAGPGNAPAGSTGQAIVFDGDRDSVLAPNAVQLISDYTSVSFWIRVDGQNLQDAEAYILDFGHWSERWKISLPQHLKIVWTTNSKNAQFPNAIHDMDSGDGNELVIGFWWFVTMVHDGERDIIYLDGQEVNNLPAPGTLNSTGRPFGMGNNPIEGGQYFQGALDEVKIYNKALTAEEVMRLYASGTTGTEDLSAKLDAVLQVIYPNPGTQEVHIAHKLSAGQSLLIRVMDAAGRQIDAVQFDKNELASGQLITLDVEGYQAGEYFINFVVDGKNSGTAKFVKK